jgi:hypothetical protein
MLACTIVRLPGHPSVIRAGTPDLGLGKLIDAVDLVIRPAADGMTHDVARLERIAGAFLAKPAASVARDRKIIDVRALVSEVDVISGEAADKLCAALDWSIGPLLRARVRTTSSEGSAKPNEVARALGVWGSDDPRGLHAQLARLSVVPRA